MHQTPLSPHGTLKPSRTDEYEHAINGLLTARADLFNEAERIRDRLAAIKNDVGALDRTLRTLGYSGDLDAIMPRQKVYRLFGTGELLEASMNELRHADGPMKSRDIARAIVALRGDDARDRAYVTDITRRVSKCLRKERERGTVRARMDGARNLLWELVN